MSMIDPGAQHVISRLMRESLMDKALIAGPNRRFGRSCPI